MILQGWRLVDARFTSVAFTGDGAARYGGRWNSVGTAIVYTSATISLAALEMLVHLDPDRSQRFKLFEVRFDRKLVVEIDPSKLSRHWRSQPAPNATRLSGDRWHRSLQSAVLQVPSVLSPRENNYLLNPAHPDFHKIEIGRPSNFSFDPRLLT